MHIEGIYRYDELLERGYTQVGIEHALKHGSIERVAHGWYAESIADSKIVRALKLGGKIGCLSGCRLYGVWTPSDSELHIIFSSSNDVPVGVPSTGVCTHVRPRSWTREAVWPILDCLDHVIRFHDAETSVRSAHQTLAPTESQAARPHECPSAHRTPWYHGMIGHDHLRVRVRLCSTKRRRDPFAAVGN